MLISETDKNFIELLKSLNKKLRLIQYQCENYNKYIIEIKDCKIGDIRHLIKDKFNCDFYYKNNNNICLMKTFDFNLIKERKRNLTIKNKEQIEKKLKKIFNNLTYELFDKLISKIEFTKSEEKKFLKNLKCLKD